MNLEQTQTSKTDRQDHPVFSKRVAIPGLVVSFSSDKSCEIDRCVVTPPFIVGRSSTCHLTIKDLKISKQHFRIVQHQSGFRIEDTGSTNGTFVNGAPLVSKQDIVGTTLIRVGNSLLTFVQDVSQMLQAQPSDRFGMAGKFHTAIIVRELRDASKSVRHILLTGPSGTGKELASRAVFAMRKGKETTNPFVAHNAARFANEEEASATLFGVAAKVFSNVEAREGLIEQANGGILFLDEVHNLPERIQRTLLRIIEDGETSRIGETRNRQVDVGFILASNSDGETCGLAHDLFARLRRVRIPPLCERIADIPDVFDEVLRRIGEGYHLDGNTVLRHMGADHYEALCLDGFKTDNVRGLVDLADRIMTRISGGLSPSAAITDVFSERFANSPVASRSDGDENEGAAHYVYNKDFIIAAYRECNTNISATERTLKAQGFQCSRRWLTYYLERWGIKPKQP